MILTLAFYLHGYLWKKNEFRKMGIEKVIAPQIEAPMYRVKGFIIPEFIIDSLIGAEEFEIRPDDVWICTFPKSGTTWMQEMTYLLLHDGDFGKAKSQILDLRSPFFEFPYPGKAAIAEYPSPRLIKTHFPYALLPRGVREGKCKVIYVMRNPKDVVVSTYHFVKAIVWVGFKGDVSDIFETFLNGLASYGPYTDHLKQYWEQRHRGNFLIVTYEEMKQDLSATVRTVARFLDKPVTTEQVAQITKWCSFASMKDNPMANYSWFKNSFFHRMTGDFMRKGVVGDWKNHFTPEMSRRLEEMCERELKPVGIDFHFD